MEEFSPLSTKEMLAVVATHEVFKGFDNESSGRLEESLSYQIIEKNSQIFEMGDQPNLIYYFCLLYTSPSPRDRTRSRMPSSA